MTKSQKDLGAKTGRAVSVGLRIPDGLHEQLKAAAAANGRSVAGEAQRRLERTFDLDEAHGDPEVAALFTYMAAVVRALMLKYDEDKWMGFYAARDALHEAVDRFLPRPAEAPQWAAEVDEIQGRISSLERDIRANPPEDHSPWILPYDPAIGAIHERHGLLGRLGLDPREVVEHGGNLVVRNGAVSALTHHAQEGGWRPSKAEFALASEHDMLFLVRDIQKSRRAEGKQAGLMAIIEIALKNLEAHEADEFIKDAKQD